MADDFKPVPAVNIAIVGTGTGDGGGVAPTPNGTVAETPAGQPNLKVRVITPIVALGVRAIHTFLNAAMGVLSAAGLDNITGVEMLPIEPGSLLKTALYVGAAAAFVATGKNLVTIFMRLEGKYPLQTGGI